VIIKYNDDEWHNTISMEVLRLKVVLIAISRLLLTLLLFGPIVLLWSFFLVVIEIDVY
jgi:hypothetical protein